MKPRILVIDDEAAIRDSLRMILEYEHYEFLGASNGPEGLAQVEPERPDLGLLDIKMPGMGGMEVLRKLRGLDDRPRVVRRPGPGTLGAAVAVSRAGSTDISDKTSS